MKWILPISLIILLSFVSTFDSENKAINEKTIRKMIEHMTKIRNLFRNLEDTSDSEDESSSEESSSDESSSEESGSSSNPNSTEFTSVQGTLPAPVVNRNNKGAGIHFLSLNSFRSDRQNKKVTFKTFFIFNNRAPVPLLYFILTFVFRGGLRNLEEAKNETATCSIIGTPSTGETTQYSCEAPNQDTRDIEQIVVNPEIQLPSGEVIKSDDINFSEDAALALHNLQNQVNPINNLYILKNGEQERKNRNYFILNGNVEKYNGKKGDQLTLKVYDDSKNGDDKVQNATCIIEEREGQNYKFKCTSDKAVSGNIDLSSMITDGNDQITLYMNKDGNVSLDPNSQTTRNNPTYRKSSSGLSGGAIAGIVIACAVVLIIASIIAMMLRKPAVPINNNTSVVGLRTVDNYTE